METTIVKVVFQPSLSILFSLSDTKKRGTLEDLIQVKETIEKNERLANKFRSNLVEFCSSIDLPQGSYMNHKDIVLCCIALGVKTLGLVHLLTHNNAFDLSEMVLKAAQSEHLNDDVILEIGMTPHTSFSPPLISLTRNVKHSIDKSPYTPEQMKFAKEAPLSLARSLLANGSYTFMGDRDKNVTVLARGCGWTELVELIDDHYSRMRKKSMLTRQEPQ